MRGLFTALCLLTMAACAPGIPIDPHSSICISPAFTTEETADIVNAAQEWRDRTAGRIDLQLEINSTNCDVQLDRVPNLIVDGWTACGWTAAGGSVVKLNPDCNKLRASALHEFGHLVAWGVDHSTNAADVMSESAAADAHLTDNDVARFYCNE